MAATTVSVKLWSTIELIGEQTIRQHRGRPLCGDSRYSIALRCSDLLIILAGILPVLGEPS
jgi:hypothetical protein